MGSSLATRVPVSARLRMRSAPPVAGAMSAVCFAARSSPRRFTVSVIEPRVTRAVGTTAGDADTEDGRPYQ